MLKTTDESQNIILSERSQSTHKKPHTAPQSHLNEVQEKVKLSYDDRRVVTSGGG